MATLKDVAREAGLTVGTRQREIPDTRSQFGTAPHQHRMCRFRDYKR